MLALRNVLYYFFDNASVFLSQAYTLANSDSCTFVLSFCNSYWLAPWISPLIYHILAPIFSYFLMLCFLNIFLGFSRLWELPISTGYFIFPYHIIFLFLVCSLFVMFHSFFMNAMSSLIVMKTFYFWAFLCS